MEVPRFAICQILRGIMLGYVRRNFSPVPIRAQIVSQKYQHRSRELSESG